MALSKYLKGRCNMTITDVRVRLINTQDNNHKAICSFTIDNCFVVHDLRIIQGDNGLFVGIVFSLM